MIWPALDRAAGRGIGAAVRALPRFGPEFAQKLRPYVVKCKDEMDGLSRLNPYGVPLATPKPVADRSGEGGTPESRSPSPIWKY